MNKKQIARIIAKRDNIHIEEAQDIVQECQYAINDLLSAEIEIPDCDLYEEATEILYDYLGLEPDYLEAIMW